MASHLVPAPDFQGPWISTAWNGAGPDDDTFKGAPPLPFAPLEVSSRPTITLVFILNDLGIIRLMDHEKHRL